ncbi:MAG TPA: alpha-glucan family phosphorylase [Candidatus Hydrogenedentes bacterium]|nr:alpha-glucan family phosphorylase [Candidatus Hydrogenedentota bacterium]
MPRIKKFTVIAKLPPALEPLRSLAYNLWWSWDPEAIDLFFRIDRDRWINVKQNPVRLLGEVPQERLEELARDDGYLAHLERVHSRFQAYLRGNSWHEKNPQAPEDFRVAYMSAEFGLHESLALYSGGLGVLAGDHLKAASDMGLPLVGVGLMYREGYLQQYLNADGWQQERYPLNDFYNMPVTLVRDETGNQIVIEVEYPERPVKARVWRIDVGRVPLYLLDCDFDANEPDDREITARLYGGGNDMRVRQEILLGMGGVTMLRRLDIHPTVWHMNEGHSAFMTLQRIKNLVKGEGLSLDHAVESVKAASVFTTHTPVPAGNDMFLPEMMEHYFRRYAADVGMGMDRFLGLGRQDPSDPREPFCMTVLALKLSAFANGVSQLHGATARAMWARTWAGVPEDEVPITAITNGIHQQFWVSRDLAGLFDRYLGPAWIRNPSDPAVWKNIDQVPDAELWRTHERRRERLVNFARRRLAAQLKSRGAPNAEVEAASEALDPEVLTIAFARRFATYKRAKLLLSDPERFTRILLHPERPVQIIFAGKAHPADNQGKDLIRALIHFMRENEVRNRFVFLEDYDMNVARYMAQGVDCWLNTPRRPLEASGTSGMKSAANGGLNISIPDGWWCEAEGLGENGWSIGRGEMYENPDEQDVVESEMLYELLEQEIIPMFYERGTDDLPRRWVMRMKNAMRTINPVFNTHRMVQEYTDRFYVPATQRRIVLQANQRERSKALAEWKMKVRACWPQVRIADIESGPLDGLPYGSNLEVTAGLFLDKLSTDDVVVEVYYGNVDSYGRIHDGRQAPMALQEAASDGVYRFKGSIYCDKTGQQGFTVRVMPSHPDLADKHETALITWA